MLTIRITEQSAKKLLAVRAAIKHADFSSDHRYVVTSDFITMLEQNEIRYEPVDSFFNFNLNPN